ncbi:hypothetical protein CDD81_4769 [Ophiocordyceps australis]|uniref:PA14 domain-containing protein n=1 Tax=Ophiocordyceps australis TaxID=1399860 RepID=A0A2C5Y463_9HYPO|nr:hypothetical protein CDD81_4769 [Ophiocordyceps australis]
MQFFILLFLASLVSATTTTLTIPCIRPSPTTSTIACLATTTIIIESPLPSCPPPPPLLPGGPCPISPSCPPSGLDIHYFSNPFGGYSRAGQIPSSYYLSQHLVPRTSSRTNVSYFPQDHPPNLPSVFPDPSLPTAPYWVGWTRVTNGGVVVDANNFTLVYEGFYRAPRTGVYSICTTADNENDVFWGHGNAFSCLHGGADANAKPLVVTTGGNYINDIRCADVSLLQGQYYPFRSVMGDWQGPSAFNFTITEPGRSFESRTNDFTGRAYPHACGLFG